MPWPEPSESSTEIPEKEVGKCPCGGLFGFFLTKSAFKPKSQSGSTRTSFPASSSAGALFSLDAASPATALAVAPSLMVIASWLSTRTEVTRPSLRKAKVGEGGAGP